MNKKRFYLIISLLVLFAILVLVYIIIQPSYGQNYTAEQKIFIRAAAEVESIGVSLDEGQLIYDMDNKSWNQAHQTTYRENTDLEVLKDFEYQIVYFEPTRKDPLEGRIWVFIDKESKQMIMTFREY